MSGEVFRSALANTLRKTLDKLPMDSYKKDLQMSRFFEEDTTELAQVDDLEIGGPGLASEKAEGTAIALSTIMEGALTRYVPRTFASMLIISEEAMEDVQYKEAISAGKMLTQSMWQTVDVDAGLQCARAWDTSYTYGDALPIFSASHTLPHGGTFSNTLATAMTPSRAAVIVMASQAMGLPGHNGVTRGYDLKRVVCPKEQKWTWLTLVKSTHAPEAGQFNAINVVNSEFDLEIVANKFWDNTTTNFFIQTDCENGWRWIWRIKPGKRSWVNNEFTEMRFAVRARWARGVTDPRSAIGSQA
jgi:hypothetical protein